MKLSLINFSPLLRISLMRVVPNLLRCLQALFGFVVKQSLILYLHGFTSVPLGSPDMV